MTRQEIAATLRRARAAVSSEIAMGDCEALEMHERTFRDLAVIEFEIMALLDWSEARPPRESFPHPTAYSADLDAREYVARVLRGEE